MNLPTATLLTQITAFDAAWGAAELEGLSSEDFLTLTADLGRVQRALDAAKTQVAGELVHRSAPHLGADGLARRAGHPKPGLFLAELWQVSPGEAIRLCAVGDATRQAVALDGAPLPARYSAVGDAITTGTLSVDAAAVIVHALEEAAPFCSAEARLAGERVLVEHAPGLTIKQVAGIARQVRDRLDQEGAEPRDVIRRERRSVTLVEQPDGMMRLVWLMPPETAGLVKAGIDHLVAEQLRQKKDRDRETLATDGTVDLDDRTMPQRRADATDELFRKALGCSCGGAKAPLVTMVVRMSVDQLRAELDTAGLDAAGLDTAGRDAAGAGTAGLDAGTAQIDGISAEISATRARILAANANMIPIVLGGAGEVLDVGRDQRLFTAAQRHALAERYGGCAFPTCGHPPSYTEAHHLHWWSTGGGTDLSNAVPLCSFHHHRIHDDGWQIDMRDQVPYFVPPPWIDPDRTPRRGGKVTLNGTG